MCFTVKVIFKTIGLSNLLDSFHLGWYMAGALPNWIQCWPFTDSSMEAIHIQMHTQVNQTGSLQKEGTGTHQQRENHKRRLERGT